MRRKAVCEFWHAWQQALSAEECKDVHVGRLHKATLTLGRDERRRSDPQHSLTARTGGTTAITKIA
eukprot:5004240-Prymnesium_polylepis.1